MSTSFYDALKEMQVAGHDSPAASTLPAFITTADTMSNANGNKSFLESAMDTVESIPKFIGVSIISGANELYNIPTDIGNLVRDDQVARSKSEDVITSLDSDLGAFYKDHQQGADLVGFMLSSLVPGIAGVKMLNAGQKSLQVAIGSGSFGKNTGRALGLLVPEKKMHLGKALKEVVTNSSAANITNRNALRAIGAGLGQNTLEAVAFESAVAATLFQSPILENQDFGDFVSNVAWGAGVFGIVGGALDAAVIKSTLGKAADSAAKEARPWTFIPEQATISTSYEKIALDIDSIHAMPAVPTGLDPDVIKHYESLAKTKTSTLNRRIRTEMGKIAGGDEVVASALFQTFKKAGREDAQSAFVGLEEVTRLVKDPKAVKRVKRLEKKADKGTASVDELDELIENTTVVSYAKNWGEGKGVVSTEAPIITQLVDTLHKGQAIKVTPNGVVAGKNRFRFDTKFNLGGRFNKAGEGSASWNPLKVSALETNARYIWASQLKLPKLSAAKPLAVDVNDIPMMEKVLDELANTPDFDFVRFTGDGAENVTAANMQQFLGDRKVRVAHSLLNQRGVGIAELSGGKSAKDALRQEEIAAMVNVKTKFLSGELSEEAVGQYARKDILAMQDHAQEHTAKLVAQGSRREGEGLVDIWNIPQNLTMSYTTAPFKGVNNFVLENMTIIKEQQKLYQEGTARAAAGVLGEDYHSFIDINSGRVYEGAVPSSAGAGFVTAASSNYGTLASVVEQVGAVTSRVVEKFKAKTRDTMEPLLYKLGQDPEAAVEWSVLNNKLRGIEGEYGLNAAGDALEPLLILRYNKAVKEAQEAGKPPPKVPTLDPNMERSIALNSDKVRALAAAHIEVNNARTSGLAGIRTAQGLQFNRSPDAFYPTPINTNDFPHFALVTDESITSGNHTKTLFASSADELDEMIKKMKDNPQLRVRTKNEAEEYFKSVGQWDYEKTLNNNYIDTEARRKGVSAPVFVPTDPQKIVDDLLNWHLQRDTGLVREAVSAKYEVQFNELRRLGDEATNVATSTFSNKNLVNYAEDTVKNPFADYVKTALAVRKTADYPLWTQMNQMVDKKFSQMYKALTGLVEKSSDPKALEQANELLTRAGYKGAAYDESMLIFANAEPAKGVLTNAVQKANSIMATVVLRWDTLNAVNNAVSANVLLGAETKAIVRAISRGDKDAVGELASIAKIGVPGTDKQMFAPRKLIAKSIAEFSSGTPQAKAKMQWFKDNGFVTSISDQYQSTLDSITFTGSESVGQWSKRLDGVHQGLRKAADTGEKWTGNKLAEEFNRYVAADVMKQMSDVALKRGLITAKEQLAYINTFVNRTQGNYLAAQRPMMFQGAVGQAVGLFQTYQFNLMQQLLRHVGEGPKKDTLTLLGLQGTIHGMNGLPAFNAVNENIIGNASGNTEHRDAYSELYGAAGKQAGDWLMYGMASNTLGLLDPALKVNLYTRGDINPRHLTLVPTNPADIPFIAATGKVLGNIFETAQKLGKGGDTTSILLQGIEHNGLSRPLAGLAQTLQGFGNVEQASYSTSNRGNVVAANDLISLTNLGRVVGGKPLDEAIALDASYRYKSYASKDTKRRQLLGESVKSTLLAGGNPTPEQMEDFAEGYAKTGGRQEDFSKWVGQLHKTANLSQSNAIIEGTKTHFSQQMQELMGGEPLRDFSGTPEPR